ncbi:hypothetical protein T4B_7092 [Trichinella pseudospiralis]|uniref:Uncharacterized protein n=1 Tax=Trichinella pseudospiralis TaxID=6337 RepID=A0A0V1K070_TRIPS|nr:hypothetical protein T4A_11488 [Trichinella pseudospiralis]KRZ28916.1 hypothetical protein T4B_7092 [Trichinella pseudospiralis]KRZ40644.1 hypothetical protein T4C_5161 [Trichinella pseudospiralis]
MSGFRGGFVDPSFDQWQLRNRERDSENFTSLVTSILFLLRFTVRYPLLASQYPTKNCSLDFSSDFFRCPEGTWTIAKQPKTFKCAKFGLRPDQASSGTLCGASASSVVGCARSLCSQICAHVEIHQHRSGLFDKRLVHHFWNRPFVTYTSWRNAGPGLARPTS